MVLKYHIPVVLTYQVGIQQGIAVSHGQVGVSGSQILLIRMVFLLKGIDK